MNILLTIKYSLDNYNQYFGENSNRSHTYDGMVQVYQTEITIVYTIY